MLGCRYLVAACGGRAGYLLVWRVGLGRSFRDARVFSATACGDRGDHRDDRFSTVSPVAQDCERRHHPGGRRVVDEERGRCLDAGDHYSRLFWRGVWIHLLGGVVAGGDPVKFRDRAGYRRGPRGDRNVADEHRGDGAPPDAEIPRAWANDGLHAAAGARSLRWHGGRGRPSPVAGDLMAPWAARCRHFEVRFARLGGGTC